MTAGARRYNKLLPSYIYVSPHPGLAGASLVIASWGHQGPAAPLLDHLAKKKPRTGGSGASRVPWGEPVTARDEPSLSPP